MGVRATSHFAVGVRDMERSLRFYRDLLGLRVTVDREEHYLDRTVDPPVERVRHAAYLRWGDGPDDAFIVLDRQEAAHGQPATMWQIGVHHVALWVDDLQPYLDGRRPPTTCWCSPCAFEPAPCSATARPSTRRLTLSRRSRLCRAARRSCARRASSSGPHPARPRQVRNVAHDARQPRLPRRPTCARSPTRVCRRRRPAPRGGPQGHSWSSGGRDVSSLGFHSASTARRTQPSVGSRCMVSCARRRMDLRPHPQARARELRMSAPGSSPVCVPSRKTSRPAMTVVWMPVALWTMRGAPPGRS